MARNPSIDLHVHSVYSDGGLTPEELAARARLHNVVALAITDHDSMSGTAEKIDACRRHGVECVVGLELSCELDGREAHILSLFANPESPWTGRVDELGAFRERRMELMLERLAALGIRLEMADLPHAADGVYGRPHLARAMLEKGVVKSIGEAFARYLYDGGPVHVVKNRLPAEEGILLAQRLGGVAILAHPGVSGLLGDLDRLVAMGMDGVEVYHPKHGGGTVATLLRYCGERKILASGGSDFHQPGEGPDIGASRTPVDILEPLREKAATRKG